MRITHLLAILAAQLLSLYNEGTKPSEEDKWVNLCLEEIRNGARQNSVLRGFCNAARYPPEQPGLEDENIHLTLSDKDLEPTVSRNECRSLRQKQGCCLLLWEDEQSHGWVKVQPQLLRQGA